jgi:energy-coupling factor transport system permease protein
MFIEKIHPHTKVIFSLAMIFLSAINDTTVSFFVIIPLLFVLHFFNRSIKTFITSMVVIIPYLFMLTLIYGLLGEVSTNNWIVIYNFKLNEVVLSNILYRSKTVVVMVFMLSSLFKHTSSDSMLLAYSNHGFAQAVSFLFMNIKNTLSHLKQRASNVLIAQQTRGINTKGLLTTRIRALWPMIMPLTMSAMMDSQERQMTLYVRGFDLESPRENIQVLKKHKLEKLFEICLIGLVILNLVWEVYQWLN